MGLMRLSLYRFEFDYTSTALPEINYESFDEYTIMPLTFWQPRVRHSSSLCLFKRRGIQTAPPDTSSSGTETPLTVVSWRSLLDLPHNFQSSEARTLLGIPYIRQPIQGHATSSLGWPPHVERPRQFILVSQLNSPQKGPQLASFNLRHKSIASMRSVFLLIAPLFTTDPCPASASPLTFASIDSQLLSRGEVRWKWQSD